MAILVILVSSGSSEDSVRTPAGRVILFGTIPTTIPDTTPVITPPSTQTDTTVIPTETPIIAPTIPPSPDYTLVSLDYTPASETESNPSEDPSSGHIPPLPVVSPFLSSDDDTTDSDTPDSPPSPTHDTLLIEITTSTQRSPVIPRRRVMILTHKQPIPHGRSYRYHPNGPRVRDIGYLADIEVGPRETRVERVMNPAMLEDIPEPAQEGAVEEHWIVGVESAVTVLIEMVAELERVNGTLRGTASVEMISHHLEISPSAMLLCYRKMPNTRSRASMTHKEVEELVARRVAGEIEAREAARNLETLNENGDEQEGENGGNGGNGNGDNEGNENGGNPHTFLGTKGVVGLARWFEKMKIVFNISNCLLKYQVKYATCTLQDSALTWWNSHKRTIGVDSAYSMKWAGLMKLMIEVYCLRNEELILMCTRMVPDEEDRVERFIGGLPDNIQRNVMAMNPARLQDTIRIANQFMDKKLQGYAVRSAENKRRMKDCPKMKSQNRGNQTRNKTGNKTRGNEVTATAYAIGGGGTNRNSNVVMGLLGHPFNIDLMPVEVGSFDVIIGMDWFAKYQALIVCDEKVVRIPYRDETLLPQIRAEIREEFRMSSGPSDAGGNPPPTSIETSTEFMQRFLRLAGFLGAAAGTEEEQAKNFQWGLC
nr:hypothetical protein [Tanacetum cinerariifolium]